MKTDGDIEDISVLSQLMFRDPHIAGLIMDLNNKVLPVHLKQTLGTTIANYYMMEVLPGFEGLNSFKKM